MVNIFEGVLNVVVLADALAEAMRGLGKAGDFSGSQILFFNLLGFMVGIVAVWLYAAIRPRFGAGPGTAVRAGIATWLLFNLLPNIGLAAINLFPAKLVVVGMAVGIVELVLAALAGAWLYREE